MRAAYADPPYPGQAKKHYGEGAREVNHRLLVNHLDDEFDAWALSTGSYCLGEVLDYCPDDVRIASWVKPFAVFKPGVNPAYAWEPIIFSLGRQHPTGEGHETVRDWVSANVTVERGTAGAKPEEVCYWLFRLLNLKPDDEFVDLFPGSGAVSDAWDRWSRQTRLAI